MWFEGQMLVGLGLGGYRSCVHIMANYRSWQIFWPTLVSGWVGLGTVLIGQIGMVGKV